MIWAQMYLLKKWGKRMNNVLNLTFYKGEDLYSDGEIEENLLEVVKTYDEYEEF